MPEVYDRLTIGFNSTVRGLETLARQRRKRSLSGVKAHHADESPEPARNLSLVFVCRQNLPDIMTSSLPLLAVTSAPASSRVRLVEISPDAETQIARALNQPRVGVIGIDSETAGAESLVHLVQEVVPTMALDWLEPTTPPMYHSVKVHTSINISSKPDSSAPNRKRKRAEGG
jgi:hypothetical protein